jgi:TP901 family phage tail tape measure protein
MALLNDTSENVGVLVKTSADNSGIDKTNAGLDTLEKKAGSAAGSATTSFDRFNRSLGASSDVVTRLGGTMSMYVSAPLAAIAVGSLKMAGDFQQSLNILQSVTGATANQMRALSQEAKDLGNDVSLPGISAKDAAGAMTELAKAGLSVNDVMTASKGVLSLAKAGQVDVATAAMTTARALNAFELSGDNANKIADLLAAGANASTASVSDMALGLQMAGAETHQFGISLQDTVTALSMFSNAGINGSDAGTSLKQMLIQLVTPSNQAKDVMKDLGLQFFDAQGKFIGLANMSGMLNDKLRGLTDQQKNAALATIFGSDAVRVASIMANGGADAFNKMSEAVNKSGAAADLAAAQNAGFNGALDNLKSTAETAMITIGTQLLPIVTKELQGLTNKVRILRMVATA